MVIHRLQNFSLYRTTVAREADRLRQPEAPAAHVERRAPVLRRVRLLEIPRGEVDGEAPLVVPVWQRAAPAERKGSTLDAQSEQLKPGSGTVTTILGWTLKEREYNQYPVEPTGEVAFGLAAWIMLE